MEERPVRLVLVDLSRTVGLAERSLWELATRLSRERYQVHVWLAADPSADGLAEALETAGFGVERLGDNGSRWDPRAPFHLWLKLRRERPRLVHAHVGAVPGSLRVARAAAADGVPVIVTRHADAGDATPDARRVYARADGIVTVTQADAELLKEAWGLRRERVRWIPYGTDPVDEELERPVARAWRDHLGARPLRPLWVCPLRLEPGRGLETLLEAAAEVRRRDLDFLLVFPGDGPLRPELERRVAALGLGGCVRFPADLGPVAPLEPLLAAADVVAFPVLDGPLPLTLLDALARARPVVASLTPATRDVIEDGEHGRLVAAGAAAPLADALDAFHRRPDAAQRIGRVGALRVQDAFAWDRVVASYEDAYDEVLGLSSFVVGS